MTEYKSPNSLAPYSNVDSNYLWIKMSSHKLLYQTTFSKRGGEIFLGGTDDTFKFLAPITWMETLSHDWTEYDSVAARFANKLQEGAKTIDEGVAMKNALGEGKTIGAAMFGSGAGNFQNRATGVISKTLQGSLGQAKVSKTRVDSPMVYTNSSRREWNWQFNLVSTRGKPMEDVVEPIKRLTWLSAPDTEGNLGIGIKLPYIFKLTTEPNIGLLNVITALTSVQPTWFEPYQNGVPTRAELTLSFKEMAPIYRSTLSDSGANLISYGPIPDFKG